MEQRKLMFKDAIKIQKLLKKSNLMVDLQNNIKEIDLNDGLAIISTILTLLVDKFDLIEKEFIEFIEDVYNIKDFKELELSEAFEMILNLKNNESFEDFLKLLGKNKK